MTPQEQAAEKPTERAPMLSDERLGRIDWKHVTGEKAMRSVAQEIRDFYETLITSGELLTKESLDARIASGELIPRKQLAWGRQVCNDPERGYVELAQTSHGYKRSPPISKERYDQMVAFGAQVVEPPPGNFD